MHPIENIMQTAMAKIKEIVDVNTIVGDPVVSADGATIIPITKVSFAFVAGGGEYGDAEGGSSSQGNQEKRVSFRGRSKLGHLHHAGRLSRGGRVQRAAAARRGQRPCGTGRRVDPTVDHRDQGRGTR